MKKLLFVLLGAAGALLVKTILDRRAAQEGALPRPMPAEFDGEVLTVEDELRRPFSEI